MKNLKLKQYTIKTKLYKKLINIKYVNIYFIFINTLHIHRHIKMNDILTIDRSCGGKFDISNDIQRIRDGKSYSGNELKEIIYKADYRIVWINHILDEYKEEIINTDNKYNKEKNEHKKLQDKYNNDKENYINQIKELKNKLKETKDKLNNQIDIKNKDIKDYMNVITYYEYTMWSFIIIMFSYIIYKLLFFKIY